MSGKTFWFLSETVGDGDEDLGRILMRNLIYSLARAEERPSRLMFMNGAVRLTCRDSASLDDLRMLAEAGAVIKSCGTCLDYLGLSDTLAVGEVGDMKGSVGALAAAPDVVTVA